MFAAFSCLNYHSSQAKHDNENLQRASWYLHQSLKTTYINTVCTKSASKDFPNCIAVFGSSACLS